MNNKGVGTRFSINQEEATFVCTNQVGMSTIPCGMEFSKSKCKGKGKNQKFDLIYGACEK